MLRRRQFSAVPRAVGCGSWGGRGPRRTPDCRSFYWHFTDIAAYRAALVQAWGELRGDDRRDPSELERLPPRERLSEMMSSLVTLRHWTLERAMREWARSD